MALATFFLRRGRRERCRVSFAWAEQPPANLGLKSQTLIRSFADAVKIAAVTQLVAKRMTKTEFLSTIQSRTARVAIGASTVRGRGNKGTVTASRQFLRSLLLQRFALSDQSRFAAQPDRTTGDLCAALPPKAQHWGLARKILNIFLRDCLYTTYLSEAYQLQRAENFLELPLDSITARELQLIAGRGVLPRWPGVRRVTPDLSARYQAVAAKEAKDQEIARAHLDALWWSAGRDL
jgi:hypothetical protein